MIKKLRWHTPYSKILRWTRWCNSFFDWEPNSWPKNDIYSVTPSKMIFGCLAINVIFWPWNRLSIEKRVAPACSAQNFTIGGLWAQKQNSKNGRSQGWLKSKNTIFWHQEKSCFLCNSASEIVLLTTLILVPKTPYSKILRWRRWRNSFFDWDPISWPKMVFIARRPKITFGDVTE